MRRTLTAILITWVTLCQTCASARADGGATASAVLGFVGKAAAAAIIEEVTRHLINTFPWEEGVNEFDTQVKRDGRIRESATLIVGQTESTLVNSRSQKMWYGKIKMKREDSMKLNYVVELQKVKITVNHKQQTVLVSLPEIEVGPTEIAKTRYSESHTRIRKWFSSDTRQALIAMLDQDSRRSIKKEATDRLPEVQSKVNRSLLGKERPPLNVKGYQVKFSFASTRSTENR